MQVPDGWSEEKLGDLFEFKNGANTEAANYGSRIKFVNVMDIFGNNFLTCEKIRESVNLPDKKANLYRLKMGDVLFNRTSETFDEIALTSVYLDSKLAIFGGFVIRGRPTSNCLNPQFCIYCFSSSSVRKESIRRGQGAIRANIGQADMRHVPLLVPPLPEQQKIAQVLSSWDDGIEKLEVLIAAKQKRKKALMQQLLTGKNRFAGFYGEWNELFFSEFLDIHVQGVSKPNEPYIALGIRSHGKGTFQRFVENPDKVAMDTLYKVEPSDLIINITFAWEGAVAIVKEGDSNCLVSHRFPNYKFNELICLGDYFKQIIMTKRFVFNLGLISPGGAGRNRVLSKKDFLKQVIKLPPIEEQQKIASVLSVADQEIETHKNQLASLKQQKKGLMQQLLTGKKRVKVGYDV